MLWTTIFVILLVLWLLGLVYVLPGTGKAQSEFVGLENAPVALEEKGLKIVLITGRLGSLRPIPPGHCWDLSKLDCSQALGIKR